MDRETARVKKTIVIGLDGANPNLIEEYSARGHLPNFSRFLKQGSFSDALSCPYGATPINWATVATGAYSGTHGISTYGVHEPGTPMDAVIGGAGGYRADTCKAEFIWDAAERAGLRTATISYPCSYFPKTAKSNIFIGDVGIPGQGSGTKLKDCFCFTTLDLPGTEKIIFSPSKGWLNGSADKMVVKEAMIEILANNKDSDKTRLYLGLIKEKEEIKSLVLSPEKDFEKTLFEISEGEWSSPIALKFGKQKGLCRAYLTKLSGDGSDLILYFTEFCCEEGFVDPPEIGKELLSRFGPYWGYIGKTPYTNNWINEKAWLDEAEYQGMWQVKVMAYLMDNHQVNLCFNIWHFLDHIGHTLLGYIDPLSPYYVAEEKEYWEQYYIKAYQIADRMLGYVMDWADEDTIIIVVSDHGEMVHINAVSINNILANHGFISFRKAIPIPEIDWSKTKAFAHPASQTQIRINLRGRDPEGCVAQDDYEKVQEEIIDVLLNVRDPQNGKRCFSLAIKKQHAAYFGLWGDRAGDILYFMNPGYTAEWWGLTNDLKEVEKMGHEIKSGPNYDAPSYRSEHGGSLPSVRYGRGGELAVFAVCGKSIRKGYRRNVPIRLVDITPTICYLMGFSPPQQCEGAIVYDFLRS